MAMIKCPECEKDISDKAIKCVHCGYAINSTNSETTNKKEKNTLFDKWFIVLFPIIVFLGYRADFYGCLSSTVTQAKILTCLCCIIYFFMLFKMKNTKIQIILSAILAMFLGGLVWHVNIL